MWMSSSRRKRFSTFHQVERSSHGWEMKNVVLVQLRTPFLSSKAFSQVPPCTPHPYIITPCYSVLLHQGFFFLTTSFFFFFLIALKSILKTTNPFFTNMDSTLNSRRIQIVFSISLLDPLWMGTSHQPQYGQTVSWCGRGHNVPKFEGKAHISHFSFPQHLEQCPPLGWELLSPPNTSIK